METFVGKVLLSEPFLQDPNFERTVVLITQHTEEGSVGFVLNNPSKMDTSQLVPQLGLPNLPVYIGGPVGFDTLNLLHYTDFSIPQSLQVKSDVWWGGEINYVIDGFQNQIITPENIKIFHGYSGWAPGQLEDEIKNDDWIMADIHSPDIFDAHLIGNDLWKKIVKSLGPDYKLMANFPIDPSLN